MPGFPFLANGEGAMRPILVDVSRTMSRAFKPVPTGIDRVERAYIRHFIDSPETLFVARQGSRHVVFDRDGMKQILARIDGTKPWSTPGKLATLMPFSDQNSAARSATTNEFAAVRGSPQVIAAHVSGTIGRNCWYLNVGHNNLAGQWLDVLKTTGGMRICAMIHDVIPLEYPQFQTAPSIKRFAERFAAIANYADAILANSRDTANRVKPRLSRQGRSVAIHAVPLGIEPAEKPAQMQEKPPNFIMLGTIEPRKNHRLVLQAWDMLPEGDRPILHIVGARGWQNDDVFRWLDTSPLIDASVLEHGPLPDEQARQLMVNSTALLFPSLAEGFGLPVLEALQMGVPVVANRLPVLEELAGNSLLYMDSQDAKVWSTIISRIAKSSRAHIFPEGFDRIAIPRWAAHFQQVEAILT